MSSTITPLVDFPTDDIIINYVKEGIYGYTFNNKMKDGGLPIFYMGKWETLFGASQQVDEKTGKPGKPRIELELKRPEERSELQQKTYEKILEFKARAAKIITEVDKKFKVMNNETNDFYTEEEMMKMITNPMPTKRSKSKKEINPITNREEGVLYPPKIKLSLQYASSGKDANGKNIEDPSRVREMYNPVTKEGNRLFRDENNKVMSTMVSDLQESIPPRSTLEVWATFAYTHVGAEKAFMNIQPVLIKRVSVQASGAQLPSTIGGFDEDDTLEPPPPSASATTTKTSDESTTSHNEAKVSDVNNDPAEVASVDQETESSEDDDDDVDDE